MTPFLRRRGMRGPSQAQVGAGFVATEAPAMQTPIVSALRGPEDESARIVAELTLAPGADGRVVVVWRNRYVGFAPAAHRGSLLAQLDRSHGAALAADGFVYRDGDLWRVWVGPEPAGGPPAVDDRHDELVAPVPTIFGIPLGRTRQSPATPATPQRWTLAVDGDSWDLRDGVDVDVDGLRSRLSVAEPGDTLRLRIWDETVVIAVHDALRVTLTPAGDGSVEVLYPPAGG